MTPEKVAIVQDADAIWREEIAKAGLDKEINQYYAALTNMRSVGVMGDERTYDYAVALRAVTTTDFMTAESYNMPARHRSGGATRRLRARPTEGYILRTYRPHLRSRLQNITPRHALIPSALSIPSQESRHR